MMSTVPPRLIRPIPEVQREKHSTLDYERLPRGEFHMNFRPRFVITSWHGWNVIRLLVMATGWSLLCTAPILYLIAPVVATTDWCVAALFVGALAVFACATGLVPAPPASPRGFSNTMLALVFIAPTGIWAVLALATMLTTPEGALLYLAVLALPAITFAADQIATHAVYWMTANPTVPAEVMQACRQAWAERFGVLSVRQNAPVVSAGRNNEGEAVVDSYQDYWFGFLWLIGSTVLPGFAVLACSSHTSRAETGFECVLSILLSLAAVSLIRAMQQPTSFRRYWRFVVHFLCFRPAVNQMPGWVFQSPCGSVTRRRRTMAGALFLVTLATIPAADYFTYFIVCPASAPLIPANVLTAFTENSLFRFPLALKTLFTGEYYLGFCLFTAGLACMVLPALILILATFIVIGPVVSAHHHALEE